jgi:hypothetical protein
MSGDQIKKNQKNQKIKIHHFDAQNARPNVLTHDPGDPGLRPA